MRDPSPSGRKQFHSLRKLCISQRYLGHTFSSTTGALLHPRSSGKLQPVLIAELVSRLTMCLSAKFCRLTDDAALAWGPIS